MIKTRIFQFVGHIHNMQLCIEMISFINHENESILRWFYRFCEPRNFSLCPRNLVGVYSGGLGVWFMTFCCCLVEFGFSCFNHASIESWFANYSVLDILHCLHQKLHWWCDSHQDHHHTCKPESMDDSRGSWAAKNQRWSVQIRR